MTRKRQRAQATQERNRQYVYKFLKSNPCKDCGEPDPVVLQFDHRDRLQKKAGVSRLVLDEYSLKVIKNEIDKCDVRCANCHTRKTAKEFKWEILSYK